MSPMYPLRVMSLEFNCNMHVNAYYTDPLEDLFERFPVSFLRKTGKGNIILSIRSMTVDMHILF